MASVDAVQDRRLHDAPERQMDYQRDLEILRGLLHSAESDVVFWDMLGQIIEIRKIMNGGSDDE